jgi:hypothetical protein
MKIAYLAFIATAVAAWPQSPDAEARRVGVCEVLNSAADHQTVLIHAAIASNGHMTYLFDGTGNDPCPGWRKRFFTAPSSIPILTASYSGVPVSSGLSREYIDFSQRLKSLQRANPSTHHMVTISGVVIRKRWPLIFRRGDGSYVDFGGGVDGGHEALLVVTSAPVLDR